MNEVIHAIKVKIFEDIALTMHESDLPLPTFNGVEIEDPNVDETRRQEVDAIEYYGPEVVMQWLKCADNIIAKFDPQCF